MTDAAVDASRSPSRAAAAAARAGACAATLALLGPAFVACIAYVDPGNFATNIAGGAKYGYLLLWVLLAANLMAMLIQNLSAKIGIATGRNLPELCREHFPRPVDLGAVGPGRAHRHGHRPGRVRRRGDRAEPALRRAALPRGPHHRRRRLRDPRRCRATRLPALRGRRSPGCSGSSCSASSTTRCASASTPARRRKGFIPGFAGTDSVLLATGILGATVMPHVIYLHSALTQDRDPAARRRRAPRAAALPAHRRDRSRWASRAWSTCRCSSSPRRCSTTAGCSGLDSIEERPRAVRGAGRRRGRAGLRAGAAGLGPGLVERRHLRRPGRHAGLHRAHDPARRCAGW